MVEEETFVPADDDMLILTDELVARDEIDFHAPDDLTQEDVEAEPADKNKEKTTNQSKSRKRGHSRSRSKSKSRTSRSKSKSRSSGSRSRSRSTRRSRDESSKSSRDSKESFLLGAPIDGKYDTFRHEKSKLNI